MPQFRLEWENADKSFNRTVTRVTNGLEACVPAHRRWRPTMRGRSDAGANKVGWAKDARRAASPRPLPPRPGPAYNRGEIRISSGLGRGQFPPEKSGTKLAWRALMSARGLAAGIAVLLLLSSIGPARAAVEIQWWHAMQNELKRLLEQLATDFNGTQSEYKVVPVAKGLYTETLSAAILALRSRQHPAIVQVAEVATATMMAAKGAVYPVHELMRDQGEGSIRAPFCPPSPATMPTSAATCCRSRSTPRPRSSITTRTSSARPGSIPTSRRRPGRTWRPPAAPAPVGRAAAASPPHWPSWVQHRELLGLHNLPIATRERLRRAGHRADHQQRRHGAPRGQARRMAEEPHFRLWRTRDPRRRQIPQRRMRHVPRHLGDARRPLCQRPVRGRLRHAALLAGRAGRAAELDHRRRHAVGAQGPAGGRIPGRGQVLRPSVAPRRRRRSGTRPPAICRSPVPPTISPARKASTTAIPAPTCRSSRSRSTRRPRTPRGCGSVRSC